MKKRGGSHVGFILSFIIFVFFVLFIFVILYGNDRGAKSEKDFVLNALSDKLISETTTELTSVSFRVRDGDIDIVVKNEVNDPEYNIAGPDKRLLLRWDNTWTDNERYFKVYKSAYFNSPGYTFGGGA